ncbi:MAG: hypothetical protein AAB874_04115 [Patescibacteria group bacterium]
MNKTVINALISNMQRAKILTKTTPWLIEGMGKKHLQVRYIGIKPYDDWTEIIPAENNLLLKFVFDKPAARIEFYIANSPPFFKFHHQHFPETVKWETILGELKRLLRKDKEAHIHHQTQAGNLYELILPHLK